MNIFGHVSLIFVVSLVAMSCKTSNDQSPLHDIGVINTSEAEAGVIYEDNGTVYYKSCKPLVANPGRNCATATQPQSMRLDEYINKLPYDVGSLERNDEAMSTITKIVDDARAAVTGGNQAAVETLKITEARKLNLQSILKIRDALRVQNKDLTYYEFEKDFGKIMAPFGKTPAGIDQDLDCADYYASSKSLSSPMTITENSSDVDLEKDGSIIHLIVPSDAVVFIDAYKSQLTGRRRSFIANVPSGMMWSWDIKVICSVNGKQYQTTKRLKLVRGRKIELAIDPIHP